LRRAGHCHEPGDASPEEITRRAGFFRS
jgi:hypothetical protein